MNTYLHLDIIAAVHESSFRNTCAEQLCLVWKFNAIEMYSAFTAVRSTYGRTALNSLYNGTICMAALAGFYTTHAVKKLQKFVLYEKNMQKEKLTKKRFLTDDTYQRIIAFKFKIPYVPRLLYLK